MNCRPDDIRNPLLWYQKDNSDASRGITGTIIWAEPNPEAHAETCPVCWGSHGCDRPRGHEGPHWCDCCDCADHPDPDSGCVVGPPYYGPDTEFFGDDAA